MLMCCICLTRLILFVRYMRLSTNPPSSIPPDSSVSNQLEIEPNTHNSSNNILLCSDFSPPLTYLRLQPVHYEQHWGWIK